jgi:curved DNA-binding protein
VRGRGYPAGSSGEPGDLYAEVRIVVPEKISVRERELYAELKEAARDRSREP